MNSRSKNEAYLPKGDDEPSVLGFMGTDDGQQIIALEELARCCVAIQGHQCNAPQEQSNNLREKVRTASNVIMHKAVRCLFGAEIFNRICPKDITH